MHPSMPLAIGRACFAVIASSVLLVGCAAPPPAATPTPTPTPTATPTDTLTQDPGDTALPGSQPSAAPTVPVAATAAVTSQMGNWLLPALLGLGILGGLVASATRLALAIRE